MTIAIYMLTLTLTQLFWGGLSDAIGRKNALSLGLSIGVVGSIRETASKPKKRTWFDAYRRLIKRRVFMGCCLCNFLTYGAMFAWITSGSSIVVEHMAMTPLGFSFQSAITGLAMLVGSTINGRLVKVRRIPQMLMIGLCTYAAKAEPVSPDKKFPLIVFMPGAGMPVQMYNNMIGEVVSNGYILIGVNTLFASGDLLRSDGHVINGPEPCRLKGGGRHCSPGICEPRAGIRSSAGGGCLWQKWYGSERD